MRQPPRPRQPSTAATTRPARRSAGPVTGSVPKAPTGSVPKASTGSVPKAPTGSVPKVRAAGGRRRPASTAVVPVRPAPAAPDSPATGPTGRVSTAMADRLAERSAMRRHRAWRRLLGWALALVVLAGLAWAAFWSPVLALEPRHVAVSGAGGTVDGDAVREILVSEEGVPLPRLDTVALRAEILALRGVKDVRIARSWPHGLDVVVTERVPVAAVPDGGRYVLLDAEGVRVGTRDAVPAKLPEVAVPLDDGSALALQSALRVLAALPPGLSKQVASVSADTQDDVETVLREGQSIQWGGSGQLALKVEIVSMLRKVEPDAAVIDVSSPELPVTR